MNVRVISRPRAAFRAEHDNSTPLAGRGGFFGVVSCVHPVDLTVDVIADSGVEIQHVKVASRQWVDYEEEGTPQLTGRRDLPPVGSYVYCVMPTGTYNGCFVLCSLFSDEAVHGGYRAPEDTDEDVANTVLDVEKSGWQATTDIRTGSKTVQNKTADPTISLSVDQETEGAESVTLTVHGTVITIDATGVSITTDKAITMDAGEGVTNRYTGDLTISSDGAVSISATQTGLLTLGNSVATLGAMIDDLLTQLQSLTTVGSPATQTISPTSATNLKTLQTQWQQVFA